MFGNLRQTTECALEDSRTPMADDDFDRVHAQVATIAREGVRAWYIERVDVASLLALPAVARALATLDAAAVPAASSPEFVAIERALEEASNALPQPFACAALAYFGFANALQQKITPRQNDAAACFGKVDGRWYRLEQPALFGLQPQQYVVELVTAALLGISEPRAYVDTRSPDRLVRSAQERYDRGDYDAALPLYRRLVALREQQLGAEHKSTLSAVHYTIYTLARQQRFSEALPLCEHLVAVRERTLGLEDERTRDARSWLTHISTRAATGGANTPAG